MPTQPNSADAATRARVYEAINSGNWEAPPGTLTGIPSPAPAPAPTGSPSGGVPWSTPSPMQQQLGTGPAAPQPYTPQVGAPTTAPTPAANPFQPFMDAMQQYNQQITQLQQQYQQQIADYNAQYGGQLPPVSTPQPQAPQPTPATPQPQPQTTPQPTPQSAGTPQQFPGAAPQGFPGQNTNPFTEALGGYGSGGVGFGGWNEPQRRNRPRPLGGFGGSRY